MLAAAWIIRYVTFNQWVIDHYEKGSVRSHPVGELVPLGDNYLGKTSVKGYSIRVEGVRIVDADAYYEELRSAGKIPGSFRAEIIRSVRWNCILKMRITQRKA